MSHPRSPQEWVHWLELGAGGKWIRRLALLIGLLLLSLFIGYKQFHGPASENTLSQLVVARQMADGRGYTTLVNYPQTAAWRAHHGPAVVAGEAAPEMQQPPFYAAVVAGSLRLLPTATRQQLFAREPVPPGGFGADYWVLAVNILGLWLAVALTFQVGASWFNPTVGWLAAWGLLLSSAAWHRALLLDGTTLMMALTLAIFHALGRSWRADTRSRALRWAIVAGVGGGAWFLADYSTVVVFPLLGIVWWRCTLERRSWGPVAAMLGLWLIVVLGWVVFTQARTGAPLGLAWQGPALRAGDSTAEPAVVRATMTAQMPTFSLDKFGNKGLTGLQQFLGGQLWNGGALCFAAFFVAGLVYRFKSGEANRLRWIFVGSLGALAVAGAFLDSGEGERLPAAYLAPLIIVLGAAFFLVLVSSSAWWGERSRWAMAGLLALQAVPLLHDVMEPRRLHFQYPPYYPGLFVRMRSEMSERVGHGAGWMCDVPAGAAWYSGQSVWAQPAELRDFYQVGVEQPIMALLLTPKTLGRPYFSELGKADPAAGHLGDWSQIYAGLISGRLPPRFPLSAVQRIADDLIVLVDPVVLTGEGAMKR